MKTCRKISNEMLSVFLASTIFLLMVVAPVSFVVATNEPQVRVPLVIDLSYAIAGADFVFEYSTGLEFVSYEKSDTVSSASTTPVVVKNNQTRLLGFYNMANEYVPINGKLDVGYLVFNCLTDNPQRVILSEIKVVQIVNDDTTRGEFLVPVEFKISYENGIELVSVKHNDSTPVAGTKTSSANNSNGALVNSAKDSSVDNDNDVPIVSANDLSTDNSEKSMLSYSHWIAIAILFVVSCSAGIFIITKKRANNK